MENIPPIRDDNPCYKCSRPWKKPGCHDSCLDRKTWKEEAERVNENRRQYYQRLGAAIRRK